jgi:hypothetical protein
MYFSDVVTTGTQWRGESLDFFLREGESLEFNHYEGWVEGLTIDLVNSKNPTG